MAEFYFYGTDSDCEQILAAVLSDGRFAMTPSRNYPANIAPLYSRMCPVLRESLDVNRGMYVSGDFTSLPIRMRLVNGGAYAGTYSVDQLAHCDLVVLHFPFCNLQESDLLHLGPGYFYLRPHAIDRSTWISSKCTDESKAGYRELVRRAKKFLARHRCGGAQIWIGQDGKDVLAQGGLLLHNGNWINKRGTLVRKNHPPGAWSESGR